MASFTDVLFGVIAYMIRNLRTYVHVSVHTHVEIGRERDGEGGRLLAR